MAAPNIASIDIRNILISDGIAVSGWSIYISKEPSSPDTVISIYDSGGRNAHPKILLDWPTVQIRVRGAERGYQAASAKAQEIKDSLLGISEQTVNGTKYVGIWMTGDINFITYDDENRPIFTMNFQIAREPSDTTNRN